MMDVVYHSAILGLASRKYIHKQMRTAEMGLDLHCMIGVLMNFSTADIYLVLIMSWLVS